MTKTGFVSICHSSYAYKLVESKANDMKIIKIGPQYLEFKNVSDISLCSLQHSCTLLGVKCQNRARYANQDGHHGVFTLESSNTYCIFFVVNIAKVFPIPS